MAGFGAAFALAAMVMVPGAPMWLGGGGMGLRLGSRRRVPRERTTEDEKRIEVAKAKRARKGAKRLAEMAKRGGAL